MDNLTEKQKIIIPGGANSADSNSESLKFDYNKIIQYSNILNSAKDKINYLKNVLNGLNDFYRKHSHAPEIKTTAPVSPDNRIDYFEKINIIKALRTKIFLEELKSSPDLKEKI